MKVLGVRGGSASAREQLVDQLVDELGDRGQVARVESGRVERDRAATTVRVGNQGWSMIGDGTELQELLDSLAPDHEYAILEGIDADVPQVLLGEATADDPLVEVESVDVVDVESVLDALEDVQPRETLESLVARAKRSPRADRAGAIATFTGRVRAKDGPDDPRTEYLEFEKYDDVADRRMETIGEELTEREGVFEVLLHHRTGVVPDGEDIVFVVVLAGHREEAFETVSDGIDRLKDEVPLFKREVTVEDEFWVHDRE